MYRISEALAKEQKCDFIVTGESLAQVSSQTLANLAAISQAIKFPVARPLLGFEKEETIKIAEQIGTFEISKGPELCDVLGPKHPVTKARLHRVLEEEKNLDVGKMVEDALKQAKHIQILQQSQ